MVPEPKQTPSAKLNPQDLWNEVVLTRSGIDQLLQQGKETGNLQPVHAAIDELKVKTANYERLLEEMQAPIKAVLGRNFLGTAEWQQGFGVSVGAPPPIPEYITYELLNSDCPLHPGNTIKDTHIFILIPKNVDNEPYTPLKLALLCNKHKGSGSSLISEKYNFDTWWKDERWASQSLTESEWVLIPKSDPVPTKVSEQRHFRRKDWKEQLKVYEYYAADYRQGKALEVMSAAILDEVVNRASREPWNKMLARPNYLFCIEHFAAAGRVVVGGFSNSGLIINLRSMTSRSDFHGFALVRKARS